MHREILTDKQIRLLPLIKRFSRSFGLVGGTAFALHLGHRRSVDFDLFTYEKFDRDAVLSKIRTHTKSLDIYVKKTQELTLTIDSIKTTFYRFPFPIDYKDNFSDIIKMPDLLTLCAMKAFAVGQRAKWKDYVDLYFGLKQFTTVDISTRARELFNGEFNPKLFRIQLNTFEDVDYREEVEFMPGFKVSMNEIKSTLANISTQI